MPLLILCSVLGATCLVVLVAWMRRSPWRVSDLMERLVGTDWLSADGEELDDQERAELWLRQSLRPGARVRLVADWEGIPVRTRGVVSGRMGPSVQVRWEGESRAYWFPLHSVALLWLEPMGPAPTRPSS